MTQKPDNFVAHAAAYSAEASAPLGWARLGARIRRAALVATTLHLVQTARSRPDGGAAVETPRVLSGG